MWRNDAFAWADVFFSLVALMVVGWNAGTVLLVPAFGSNKKDRPGVPPKPGFTVVQLTRSVFWTK
jgi:hypothetical protein